MKHTIVLRHRSLSHDKHLSIATLDDLINELACLTCRVTKHSVLIFDNPQQCLAFVCHIPSLSL